MKEEREDKWIFDIPKGQIIPTQLKVKKGNIKVYYERFWEGTFGYEFTVYDNIDGNNEEIVKEIAKIMCNQSFDHWSEWRITKIEQLDNKTYKVYFRIKDSY